MYGAIPRDIVEYGNDGMEILLDLAKRKNVFYYRDNHDYCAQMFLRKIQLIRKQEKERMIFVMLVQNIPAIFLKSSVLLNWQRKICSISMVSMFVKLKKQILLKKSLLSLNTKMAMNR